MHKYFLSIVLLLITFFSSQAQCDTLKCDFSGCVGDVKYSILKPDSFRKINGDGWILLDGGANVETIQLYENSTLKKILQLASLPDARGVFLRGMNETRAPNLGNPDGDKPDGTAQMDAFQGHYHKNYFNGNALAADGSGNRASGWGVTTVAYEKNDPVKGPEPTRESISDTLNGEPRVGQETRPRNIVLYIYIKIN